MKDDVKPVTLLLVADLPFHVSIRNHAWLRFTYISIHFDARIHLLLLLLVQACGDWLPESAGSELARDPIVSQSLGARRSGEAEARAAVVVFVAAAYY